jgi:hypothetical protein
MSPEDVHEQWKKWTPAERKRHFDWISAQCCTCGRPGLWGGRPYDNPVPQFAPTFCDACCDDHYSENQK